MKKAIAGFLILLVGSITGFSYWEGILAEKQWRLLLERAASSLPPGQTSTTYHRGWFSSSSEFRLKLLSDEEPVVSKGDDVPEELMLSHTLVHGPLPIIEIVKGRAPLRPIMAIVHTRIAMKGRPFQRRTARREEIPEGRIDTILNLDGGGSSDILVPPFTSTGDTKREFLVSKELRGTIVFTKGAQEVSSQVQWGGAEMTIRDVRVTLGKMTSAFTYRSVTDQLAVWKNVISLGALRVAWSPKGKEEITLRNLNFVASQETKEGNLELHSLSRVKEIMVRGQQLGSLLLELSLHHLDPSAMAMLSKLESTAGRLKGSWSREAIKTMKNRQMDKIFAAILRKSPALDMRFQWGATKGVFNASAKASFDGSDETRVKNPALWPTGIEADALISIPVALMSDDHGQPADTAVPSGTGNPGNGTPAVSSLPPLTTLLSRRGFNSSAESVFLARNGDLMESHLTYRRGHVLVNGWPLELLMQRARE